MAIEKNLLAADYTYLTDASGNYVTVTDAPAGPLITHRAPLTTPRNSLTGHDRCWLVGCDYPIWGWILALAWVEC